MSIERMTARIDSSELLEDLRRVMAEHGASSRAYSAHGAYAMRSLVNHFGSWSNAVAAAKGACPHSTPDPRDCSWCAMDKRREMERAGHDAATIAAARDAAQHAAPITGTTVPKAGMDAATQRAAFVGAMSDARPANDPPRSLPSRPPVDIGVVRRSRSRISVTLGDVHRKADHTLFLRAFMSLVDHIRPYRMIWNGDLLESGSISRWKQSPDSNPHVIDEVVAAVDMINYCDDRVEETVLIWGNHDTQRWDDYVLGANPVALKGALGLSLEAQFLAQGMHPRVKCIEQSATCAGFWINDTRIRHGHKQAGSKFGAGKNLAHKYLDETWGSVITNHHHRAAVAAKTVTMPNGKRKTCVSILNGCAESPQNFSPDGDWQWSFVVTEEHAPNFTTQTHHLVIADPETGEFSYGGVTYSAVEQAA